MRLTNLIFLLDANILVNRVLMSQANVHHASTKTLKILSFSTKLVVERPAPLATTMTINSSARDALILASVALKMRPSVNLAKSLVEVLSSITKKASAIRIAQQGLTVTSRQNHVKLVTLHAKSALQKIPALIVCLASISGVANVTLLALISQCLFNLAAFKSVPVVKHPASLAQTQEITAPPAREIQLPFTCTRTNVLISVHVSIFLMIKILV